MLVVMRRLLTPGWIACHVLMIVLATGMLALAGWQLARAAGGNLLSWGYTFQWPVFAAFVVFVWAREVRRTLRETGAPAEGAAAPPAVRRRPVITRRPADYSDAGDPDVAAYNRYLAWLNAHPGARPADYPG